MKKTFFLSMAAAVAFASGSGMLRSAPPSPNKWRHERESDHEFHRIKAEAKRARKSLKLQADQSARNQAAAK